LQAFALLNGFAGSFLGWRLHRLIGTADRLAFARWVGCMFSLGVLDSVRKSLVDLTALLLLRLATEAYTQARAGRSALWLALANLTKETSPARRACPAMRQLASPVPLAARLPFPVRRRSAPSPSGRFMCGNVL